MLALSKARALAWAVEKLDDPDSNLSVAVEDARHPKEARAWLHGAVGDARREALDEIEREYRKFETNLLAKNAASLTPKDGA
jgi:hypothetical protein